LIAIPVEMTSLVADRLAGLAPDSLHLIVMPTEKCNFRCRYCYEDFSIGRMKPAIEQALTRFILNRTPDLNRLHIGWFGGEPTLALDIIERINLCATASLRPSAMFTSSISTNAYLLNKLRFDRLIASNVRTFQVTLDGDEDAHDSTRIRQNGGGSFKVIMGNVCEALSSDHEFLIGLRIHVHGGNLASVRRLVDRLVGMFEGERRISIYLKNVEELGESMPGDLMLLHGHEHLTELRRKIGEAGLFEEKSSPPICYAARANSLVIRADGRIGKCTVALSDPRNTVATLNEDGSIEPDNEKFRPWIRGLLSGNSDELACPLVGLQ